MGEVVNLRQQRKRKAREDAERAAAERRAMFGQTKSEAGAEAERRAREARALDSHRLPDDA